MESFLKRLFVPVSETLIDLVLLSGGSTLTQQLIKQQVVGDAPTLARKATEIVDAFSLRESNISDEILTTSISTLPIWSQQ